MSSNLCHLTFFTVWQRQIISLYFKDSTHSICLIASSSTALLQSYCLACLPSVERINIFDQHFLISHSDLLLSSFFYPTFIHPEIPNFITRRRSVSLYALYVGYSLIIIQDTENLLVSFRLKMSIKQDGQVL